MGQCCSGEETESRPLLHRAGSAQQRVLETSQQQNSRAVNNKKEQGPPQSARYQSDPDASQSQEEFEGFKSIGLERVDRQFRDSLELFFTLRAKFTELEKEFRDLIGGSQNEKALINEAFLDMSATLDSSQVKIKLQRKKKHCLSVEWDETQAPVAVTEFLRRFNNVNKFCQQVIDKAGPLKSSVQLLITKEDELKRDIMAHLSTGKANADAWRSFNKNMNQLRKVPGAVEAMERRTREISDNIIRSSTVFAKESEKSETTA